MKTVIFDTETTGFPNNNPLNDPSQPHMIQIAAILAIENMILGKINTIIQCPVEVSEGAFKVHGISQERSMREGVPLITALAAFSNLLGQADRAIAHNMKFDLKIINIAYERAGIHNQLKGMLKGCTMQTVTPIMKRLGKRWTLDSAYRHFVDEAGFSDAHDAMADTTACFKLLQAMEAKDLRVTS